MTAGGLPSPHAETSAECARRLDSPPAGLSPEALEVARARFGFNRVREAPRISPWVRLGRQFRELVVLILIAAAAIALALGERLDAVVILAIVALNALLGFFQEERAARAIEALREMAAPTARALRGGSLQQVPAADLVPGDRIEIEAGDYVPADARLVAASVLRTQEASLTGESTAVKKDAALVLDPATPLGDRRNMIYMGTVVTSGHGSAVVTGTGMATELGRVAELLERPVHEPTPLQRRLDELGRVLIVVCLAAVAVITLLQMLRGGSLVEVFFTSVSLAVAAVPEGLPAVVTIALALGVQRMSRRNALVRKLPSVETLGSVSVICTDKTGTLTRNEMTVREIVAGGAAYHVTGAGYAPRGSFLRRAAPLSDPEAPDEVAGLPGIHAAAEPDLPLALTIGARCNNARLAPLVDGGENWRVMGDPTEGALLVAALKAEVEVEAPGLHAVYEIPFDADRRAMSIAFRDAAGLVTLYTKGAPEVVVAACSHERSAGAVVPLLAERRHSIQASASALAARAMRVLAVAYRESPPEGPPYVERDLVFVALVGMIDPPRDEAGAAVRTCLDAGIRPVMITGDHPQTALAIARELGIAGPGSGIRTGRDLDTLTDEALAAESENIAVYARVSAEHKLRVVGALRARGHVVAMTGDGVNDAPALQAADIGVAMGVAGTHVSREAADMVLLDDNFASIVSAVEEGRGIFDNIRKTVHYLLATNSSEVLFMLVAAVAGWPVPLLAVQILWINLVTDGLPALALGLERPERDIMRRRPSAARTPVISRREGVFILLRGALVAAAASAAFFWLHAGQDTNLPHARAVAFCVIALAQLSYAFAFRSQRYSLPELGLFTNPLLVAAVAVAGLLQVAVVTLPFTQPLFSITRPLGREWLAIVAFAVAPVTLVELAKIVRGARRRRAPG